MNNALKVLASILIIVIFMAIGSFISANKGNQTITFILLIITIIILKYLWKK